MRVPFTIQTEEAPDGRAYLWLTGELDAAGAPLLLQAIARRVRAAPAELVVDMGGVTYIDSTGLADLLAGHRIARQHSVPITLHRVPPVVQRVFELMDVMNMVNIEPGE